MNFRDSPKTETEAVNFLTGRGILLNQRNCRNGHVMKLYVCGQTFWQCNIKSCKPKSVLRIRTWFENSRVSFVTAIRFIYGWAYGTTSIYFVLAITGNLTLMNDKLSMEKSSTLEGSSGLQKGGLYVVKRKDTNKEKVGDVEGKSLFGLDELALAKRIENDQNSSRDFKKLKHISKRQSYEETPTSARSQHYDLLDTHRSKNKHNSSKKGLFSDSKIDKDKYIKQEIYLGYKRPYDRNVYFEKKNKNFNSSESTRSFTSSNKNSWNDSARRSGATPLN
ncbi:hypothetical protein HZS_5657, partial [Henneguya salminicola]